MLGTFAREAIPILAWILQGYLLIGRKARNNYPISLRLTSAVSCFYAKLTIQSRNILPRLH
jgi:hypothetical protein